MEIDKNIFEKYGKSININNLDEFEDINLIDKVIQKHIEDLDDCYYKFLSKNGYKIDKPYNIEQLNKIKEDLTSKDMILDRIEWLEYKNDKDNYSITRHIIPFFNSISNPLSEETIQKIIKEWKEKNRKDK